MYGRTNRQLRSLSGDVIRTARSFDDLETQRERADNNGDCVTLPVVHEENEEAANTVVEVLMARAQGSVGKDAQNPEVRQVGPNGANFVVWDDPIGKGTVPEYLLGKPRASAWNSTDILEDETIGLVRPIRSEYEKPTRILEGDYVGFHNWINGNYRHFVTDHLPMLAWLEQEVVPQDTKFLLLDLPVTRHVMSKLDPEFYENRLVWIEAGVLNHVTGSLTVAMPKYFPQGGFMENVLSWLRRIHPEPVVKDQIIFYSSTTDERLHGRHILDPVFEQMVIAVIRLKMIQYLGISGEQLVIFNGLDEEGNEMSFDRQYDLFSRAHTIIGPYGAGMVNMLWSAVYPAESCSKRTKVLEFIKDTSFYSTFHGLPIDHQVIPYKQPEIGASSPQLHIDFEHLKTSIDNLWRESNQE